MFIIRILHNKKVFVPEWALAHLTATPRDYILSDSLSARLSVLTSTGKVSKALSKARRPDLTRRRSTMRVIPFWRRPPHSVVRPPPCENTLGLLLLLLSLLLLLLWSVLFECNLENINSHWSPLVVWAVRPRWFGFWPLANAPSFGFWSLASIDLSTSYNFKCMRVDSCTPDPRSRVADTRVCAHVAPACGRQGGYKHWCWQCLRFVSLLHMPLPIYDLLFAGLLANVKCLYPLLGVGRACMCSQLGGVVVSMCWWLRCGLVATHRRCSRL